MRLLPWSLRPLPGVLLAEWDSLQFFFQVLQVERPVAQKASVEVTAVGDS